MSKKDQIKAMKADLQLRVDQIAWLANQADINLGMAMRSASDVERLEKEVRHWRLRAEEYDRVVSHLDVSYRPRHKARRPRDLP